MGILSKLGVVALAEVLFWCLRMSCGLRWAVSSRTGNEPLRETISLVISTANTHQISIIYRPFPARHSWFNSISSSPQPSPTLVEKVKKLLATVVNLFGEFFRFRVDFLRERFSMRYSIEGAFETCDHVQNGFVGDIG